ncbi:alpha/beta fold hydrolase [Moraxella oblonga]|uniref:alpha/beta fold hydrolase n=1 Tax=Moraxella oblonga TaxID=200413 RepID=UPI000832B0E0|nr:alpha/beta fold hydrolase [Moraxella oblonga]
MNAPTVILSTNQTHRLHHAFFIPVGEIKATLLIVHGMSEHGGRYAKFAQFLADNGILVATYDQLGHGQTAKDESELGFFDEKHPVQTLCKDVIVVANALKNQANLLTKNQPNTKIPHFIMGHSMGSFIVRTVLVHHATSFDGAILMGTGNSFGTLNTLSMGYLAVQNKLNPKKKNLLLASVVNHHLLGQITYPISHSPFAWLSENLQNIQTFENDSLCGFVFTNNGFFTLNQFIKKATSAHWYAHLPNDFGVLLVSGKDDPVGNMGQDIVDLQENLINIGKNCTVRLYPNMRHEPLHETDNQRVYQDIIHWLNVNMKIC